MRHAHPQPRSRVLASRVGACRVGASLVLILCIVTSLGALLLIDGSRGQFLLRQRRAGRWPRPVLPGLRHREVRPVLRVLRLQLRHRPAIPSLGSSALLLGPAFLSLGPSVLRVASSCLPLDPTVASHPVRISDPVSNSRP